MEQAHDYSAYAERPTDDKFAQLDALVRRQLDAAYKVSLLTQQLETAMADLKQISETELPEFMESQLGLSEVRTRNGILVQIKPVVRAGISVKKDPERAAKAFAWLRENGHAKLIKHVIQVELEKGQDGVAKTIMEALAAPVKENGLVLEDKTTVHEQTLGAFVREKLEDGTLPDVALDLLGVYRGKQAKLSTGPK